jgi:hypothetical protein
VSGELHAQALDPVMKVPVAGHAEPELLSAARLSMQLLAATSRYAITLDKSEAERALVRYKRSLPGIEQRPGRNRGNSYRYPWSLSSRPF